MTQTIPRILSMNELKALKHHLVRNACLLEILVQILCLEVQMVEVEVEDVVDQIG